VALVRTDVSEELRFLQEPHGVTSQQVAFFVKVKVKSKTISVTGCGGL
jgi:hypothetical protein